MKRAESLKFKHDMYNLKIPNKANWATLQYVCYTHV